MLGLPLLWPSGPVAQWPSLIIPDSSSGAACSLIWNESNPSQLLCVNITCTGNCEETTIPAPATLGLPPNSTVTYCVCEGTGGTGGNRCIGIRTVTKDDEGNIIATSNQCFNLDCSGTCTTITAEFEGITWVYCIC